ncbi:SIMPL domain-containing protein [Pseudalkalibacillus decolorationis]|uniref:SIMPL domain-containing protein n=1 Tax=Pseudalkalibacillus decolorationis TaxID=163879 RepID=UPI0021484464|nr:SIMPL domain-containing protein [Pseudalkalibacillus decolorationis]
MINHSYYPQHYPNRSTLNQNRNTKINNVIEVVGSGNVIATPDEVVITVGVQTSGRDVQNAVSENNSKSQQIIDGLKSIGLSNEQIGSISFTITPIYEYKNGTPLFIGYRVEHILEVKLTNVANAGDVYETAIKNGANIARELQFQLSDPQPYYERALSEAMNNAIQKARSLSNQLGVQINPVPIKVVEVSDQGPSPFYESSVKFAATAVPIQPHQQMITARIKAWFQYLSN